MAKRPNIKKDVESLVASEATDKIANYAARGRMHQNLSDQELVSAWRNAFKHMADNVRDSGRRLAEDDLKAEFVLRKQEPPYDLIREDFERFIAETDLTIKALKSEDPVRYEEMGRELADDLSKFRRKSKN